MGDQREPGGPGLRHTPEMLYLLSAASADRRILGPAAFVGCTSCRSRVHQYRSPVLKRVKDQTHPAAGGYADKCWSGESSKGPLSVCYTLIPYWMGRMVSFGDELRPDLPLSLSSLYMPVIIVGIPNKCNTGTEPPHVVQHRH